MTQLQWWMRGVGVFYILLSLLNVRFLTAPFDVGYGWLIFGLDLAIVGAALVAGAQDPQRNRILVQVVLVQEIIRGIIADIYAIWQGGSLELYIGFIVVHTVIIATGIAFSRREVVRRPDMVSAPSS